MDQKTCWRLAAPEAYASREWDGESIAYDERSGATHLLGAGATALLRVLREAPEPLTAEALARVVFPAEPLIDDRDRELVEAAIVALEQAGLIQSSRP